MDTEITVPDPVDTNKTLGQDEFIQLLAENQVALSILGNQIYLQQRPAVIVMEGWEAAEVGNTIRRVTENMDPRGFRVYPSHSLMNGRITGQVDDTAHHYLWRYWRRLPRTGQIAIFESSWYQRVLTDRVENFCSEDEWKRAFREINRFERQLVDFGTIMFKFWIDVSPHEQLRRSEAHAEENQLIWTHQKDGWYNQEKRELYEAAVDEMLLKTSTTLAPWKVVAGNSRNYAQIEILQTLVKELSHELDYTVKNLEVLSSGSKKKKKTKKKAKA